MTERLRLVPITTADIDALVDLHQAPGIADWYGGSWSRGHATSFATTMERRWREDRLGKWLAVDSHGRVVGRGGPTLTDDPAGGTAVEIGWAVRRELWSRGYATEIGAAAIRHTRTVAPAQPVISFTERHNERSRAVMQRLGMTYDREFVRPGLVAGLTCVQERATFALYRLSSSTVGATRRSESSHSFLARRRS